MAIYDAHRLITATLIPTESDNPNWTALIESRADMKLCNHYSHATPRVIVMSAGGMGDILDDSNGAELQTMAEAWECDDMDSESASHCYDRVQNEWPIITHHGNYNYTSVCVDPDEISPETLTEIISARESFDDHPVLNKDDFSEREFTAFVEEFDSTSKWTLDIEDAPEHPLYRAATDYAMENYYGYSDPGYISSEHVRNCWIKAGYIFPIEAE